MKLKKLLILSLIWLIFALPAIILLSGCADAPPLPPEPEHTWPPAQKPIETNYPYA